MTRDILIIGTGALACLFASRLSQSGTKVTMTGTWVDALRALREKGVGLVETGSSSPVFIPVDVLDPVNTNKKFSHAILLTKAYQVREAIYRVASNLKKGAVILSLQNGLTARKVMEAYQNSIHPLSGVTTCAAEILQPGIARQNGGSSVRIERNEFAGPFSDLLCQTGFDVSLDDHILEAIWEKAIINSAANPTGALLGKRNGELLAIPGVMDIMDNLIQEACTVAKAEGYAIGENDLKVRLRKILQETSKNRCSMLQDVQNGRMTEIDSINGEILRLAGKYGINTPVQNTITNLIRVI